MYIIKFTLCKLKFDAFGLFCSKVIEEKSLGGCLDPPPLGKGRVNSKQTPGRKPDDQQFVYKLKDLVKREKAKRKVFT